MNVPRLSRRRFMGMGIGASVLGVARLEKAIAQQIPAKRLVLVFSPNGTIPWEWSPEGTETSFTLGRILEPLRPRISDLLILDGVDQRSARSGPGDGHQTGMGHLWTGRELLPGDVKGGCNNCAAVSWASGPSIDQVVANQIGSDTTFRSVELGADCGRNANVWTRMCYRGAGEPLPPIDDPQLAFERLFGSFDPGAVDAQRRLTLRRSVLDLVKEDFQRLSNRLGSSSRERIERHLDTVREIERQVFPEPSETVCSAPDSPGDAGQNNRYPEIVSAQIRLGAAALGCDLTRVLSFQWNRSVGNVRMNWLGIDEGHHSISHKGDGDQEAVDNLVAINRWYAERFNDLLDELASIPEGDGSVLDNTLVVWGNELGKGNSHTRNNIPFVLAGGRNGLIRPGRVLRYETRSHTDLLAAIGRRFGLQLESFGDPRFSEGPFEDLI
ncbi:MAG: DUF1552 domain-containing protein [Myxococcota bacterium]